MALGVAYTITGLFKGRSTSTRRARNTSAAPLDFSRLSPDKILTAFETRFAQTGCRIAEDEVPLDGAPASYRSFVYMPNDGGPTFANEMLLDRDGRTDAQVHVSARHEKLHAIQWDHVPSLHASPYNQGSRYVLSPVSWVMATLLTESDAFVKTAWLNAQELKQNYSAALCDQAMTEAVTPMDINANVVDPCQSMKYAATAWYHRFKHKDDPSAPDVTFLDHYVEYAIKAYEESARLNDEGAVGDVQFVRLSREDILAIGSGFGPSIFSRANGTLDDSFTLLPYLRKDLFARLVALEDKFGIGPDANLPTLQDALANDGMSAADYMHASRSFHYTPASSETPSAEQSYETLMR